MDIKVIAFDADDTLWVNEPYFQETEKKFCDLLEDYLPHHSVAKELFKTEMDNLALYGYGVKGFMLSMIETALRVSNNTVNNTVLEKAIVYGKELLEKPIELLDGIEDVLKQLKGKYRLVVATKGDLLDQERKLKKSGIEHYFHHIEIMSDKQEKDYIKLILYAGLIAVPAAYFILQNWLKDYAFHVDIGVWFFVLPVILIVVIALLTVLYQSLRAAVANPVESLRME